MQGKETSTRHQLPCWQLDRGTNEAPQQVSQPRLRPENRWPRTHPYVSCGFLELRRPAAAVQEEPELILLTFSRPGAVRAACGFGWVSMAHRIPRQRPRLRNKRILGRHTRTVSDAAAQWGDHLKSQHCPALHTWLVQAERPLRGGPVRSVAASPAVRAAALLVAADGR